jgi:hypothetical protein
MQVICILIPRKVPPYDLLDGNQDNAIHDLAEHVHFSRLAHTVLQLACCTTYSFHIVAGTTYGNGFSENSSREMIFICKVILSFGPTTWLFSHNMDLAYLHCGTCREWSPAASRRGSSLD